MYYSVSLMYKSERTDSEPPLWEEWYYSDFSNE